MPTLVFETTVPAPLGCVWDFYDGVATALPTLSPSKTQVQVRSADLPIRTGSRIAIDARGPLGMRIRWVAFIAEHRPPDGSATSARFVDEQESGPFAFWRHEHDFEAINGAAATRVIDRVIYRVPLGPIGWIADWAVVRPALVSMFRHRHAVMHRLFGVHRAA